MRVSHLGVERPLKWHDGTVVIRPDPRTPTDTRYTVRFNMGGTVSELDAKYLRPRRSWTRWLGGHLRRPRSSIGWWSRRSRAEAQTPRPCNHPLRTRRLNLLARIQSGIFPALSAVLAAHPSRWSVQVGRDLSLLHGLPQCASPECSPSVLPQPGMRFQNVLPQPEAQQLMMGDPSHTPRLPRARLPLRQ